jgi:hypothetical protein
MHRQRQLLEVVLAVRPPRLLAGLLHGGQQKSGQDADDGDHHQQLDQRKAALSLASSK